MSAHTGGGSPSHIGDSSSRRKLSNKRMQLAHIDRSVIYMHEALLVEVVRVIDGDTIQVCCVFGDRVKVRYIGVDTPETHHPMRGVEPYGMEAAEANRKLVDGKTVRLEFDVQQVDRYNRLLAYVYLEDDTFVNAWLVEHGYAQVMTVPPNVKHQALFLKLQREAREAGRGLWDR